MPDAEINQSIHRIFAENRLIKGALTNKSNILLFVYILHNLMSNIIHVRINKIFCNIKKF